MLRKVRHLPFPFFGVEPWSTRRGLIVPHRRVPVCGDGVFSFQWFGGRRVRSSVENPLGSVVGCSGHLTTANNQQNTP